jgi:hypothetical protein
MRSPGAPGRMEPIQGVTTGCGRKLGGIRSWVGNTTRHDKSAAINYGSCGTFCLFHAQNVPYGTSHYAHACCMSRPSSTGQLIMGSAACFDLLSSGYAVTSRGCTGSRFGRNTASCRCQSAYEHKNEQPSSASLTH